MGFSNAAVILQVALLLLRLNARLQYICVRHLAAAFQLLADVEEPRCLRGRALHVRVLALCHYQTVVSLSDTDYQAAPCDLGLGSSLGQQSRGAPVIGDVRERQCFMRIRLADVFVHAVVGDES